MILHDFNHLLFILGMETLHIATQKAVSMGMFKGIQLPNNGPIISHLLYADDVIFIGDGLISNALYLTRFLRCFHLTTGLKINFEKCKLFGIGLEQSLEVQLAYTLKCQIGAMPFTYLGIPVGANMGLIKNWTPVIDKLNARLNHWKSNSLSQGGKSILIKSVLGSLPLYYLSLFRAPAAVIKRLEAIRRDFFWGSSNESKKIAWIAWDKIIAPKDCGGLGIGGFRAANVALLTKWGWKFKTENLSLWCKVVKAIHQSVRKHDFLPVRKSIAGCWKSIVHTIHGLVEDGIDFTEYIKGAVGFGNTISFWQDSWLPAGPLKHQYPSLYQMEKHKSCSVAERISLENQARIPSWKWNKRTLNISEQSLVDQLSHRIQTHNFLNGSDRWFWLGSDNGEFSSSSVRRIIENGSAHHSYKHHWLNWIPRKVNIFAWKAAMHRIPAKIELRKRGIETENIMCSWCSVQEESVPHLLLRCEMASNTWDLVSRWCRSDLQERSSVAQLLSSVNPNNHASKLNNVMTLIITAGLWNIYG